MEKSKRSGFRDRLSELPDSLIFNIFELLPMNDVIKTTILSKHWQNLWTTVPFLKFTDSSFEDDRPDAEIVRYFVNRALQLWRGIKILKFTIDFRHIYYGRHVFDDVFDDDWNVWVSWAKEKEVEEMHLRKPYKLHECLYSCSSLKVLVLSLGDIRLWPPIDGNIKWDSLKSLTIDSHYFGLDPEFISQALHGSPNLEVFNLSLGVFNLFTYPSGIESESKSVCIQSKSLKKLSIRKTWYETDKELEIVTPNLETLEISGYPYRRCVLSASSSLTDVTLRFLEHHPDWKSDESVHLYFCCEDDCEETLSKILPAIQHVERVKLSTWCIQVLESTNKHHLLSRPYFEVRD
ncbi:F-box/LRR-repeat protein At3g26922-like [Salvia miltiorrhiza]|uniref:F-box/LRR-repeat protein At3g26922-like n=1 Tax=Salvia miltiorrhiza TaxID=226208 RepID=UPI0025AD842A|nr:F-box/LRR-repeat protein At3g26922-like [Salvia miltiorrhiza]